jgi:hypothetical protein
MNLNTSRGYAGSSSGLMWMLLSAVLFGYFGFMLTWPRTTLDGDTNWISIVLMWTVRGTAIVFAVSALLTFVHRYVANMMYSATGLISAALFCVVLVWHYTTDAHAPIPPILLMIFAALNGYGSWMELRALLALRRE